MKILIISLPRTGSTSLMEDLGRKNNLKILSEPYSKESYKESSFNINENNIVLKTIIGQKPPEEIDDLEFLTNLAKKFDNTILLSRKNLKECAESCAYRKYYKEKTGFSSSDPYYWELTPNFNEVFDLIKNLDTKLKLLSEILNINVSYYEDLYKNSISGKLRLGNKNETEVKRNII